MLNIDVATAMTFRTRLSSSCISMSQRLARRKNRKFQRLGRNGKGAEKGRRKIYFKGHGWTDSFVYERAALGQGSRIEGPAVIEEPTATTLLHPGHKLEVDEYGNLVMTTMAGKET